MLDRGVPGSGLPRTAVRTQLPVAPGCAAVPSQMKCGSAYEIGQSWSAETRCGRSAVMRFAGAQHALRWPDQRAPFHSKYRWISKDLACDNRRVSVRLLFVTKHSEIDRVELAASGVKVYGRPGHPLKLDLSEVNGPPPVAQCRIRQVEQLWIVENTGAEGSNCDDNGEPRTAALSWAPGMRSAAARSCSGSITCTVKSQPGDSAPLRGQLDELKKALALANQRAALCETEHQRIADEAPRGRGATPRTGGRRYASASS